MSLEDTLYPLLSIYERSPAPLKHFLGRAYRTLPKWLRYGRNYAQFCELSARFERSTIGEIREFQTRLVREQLETAYRFCPFYRKHYDAAGITPDGFQSLDDLARFPFVEKKDLLEHLNAMANKSCAKRKSLLITTGGSTGVPVGFYLEKGVSRPKEQAFLERMWQRAGYRKGDRLAIVRGHVTTDKSGGRIASYDAPRDWLMLSSYHLSHERFPEYRRALEEFQPRILHAYPSAALQIAELIEASGQPLNVRFAALLCGSENLTLPQKRILESTFGCRVYRWYGHAERVVLAGEGVRSECFHFFPQYGYVEFGEPDAEGLQEIIGTSFHNGAMPLIRYRTGDLAKVCADSAQTDYPWPAVEMISGRKQEYLVSATGRKISLTAFNMHDSIFDGLYAVQFYQDRPGVAEFRYVPGVNFDDDALTRIEARILRKLGDDFQIRLVRVTRTERTARGKHKWLVSTL